MKKITIVAAAAVLLLGVVAVQPAEAVCPNARNITTAEPGVGTSYIYTPGAVPQVSGAYYYPTTVSPAATGVFWSLTGGNPAVNAGNDNGAVTQYYWWNLGIGFVGGGIYGSYIGNYYGLNNWSTAGIDGCIDNDGSDPVGFDPDQCMVMMLQDQVDDIGYWALLAQSGDAGDYFFNRAAGNGAITLGAIPKPTDRKSVV